MLILESFDSITSRAPLAKSRPINMKLQKNLTLWLFRSSCFSLLSSIVRIAARTEVAVVVWEYSYRMLTWCSQSSPVLIKLEMHRGFALVQHQMDVNLLWPLSDSHCAQKVARTAQSCHCDTAECECAGRNKEMGTLPWAGSFQLTADRCDKLPGLLLVSKGKEAAVLLYSDTWCILVSFRRANLSFP